MTLRVNLARGSRDVYLGELAAAGIAASVCARSDAGITLGEARDVAALPGFDAGRCSVQDESAQLAAPLLAPQPGERILDGCAAPGGKTGHLLELEHTLALVACDVSAERLARVEENLSRLGLAATLVAADLREPGEDLRALAPFDAVLLDVPCSATGVIRRHPDIKVLRREEDIPGFAAQQSELLSSSWELLQPGGRLLYVTCSVLKAENSDVIADFLTGAGDAEELVLACDGAERCAHGIQYLPQPGAGDGLYFALLQKTL
jgi:16S rRNA (cytosine967-C5)-methyltransferase